MKILMCVEDTGPPNHVQKLKPCAICSSFPAAIHFTFGSVHTSVLLSRRPGFPFPRCVLKSSLPPLWPQVRSLHLRLYSCPATRFISTGFFRFHICALAYGICFSLSDISSMLCDDLEGWDREGGREAQEGGDMGIYVYI